MLKLKRFKEASKLALTAKRWLSKELALGFGTAENAVKNSLVRPTLLKKKYSRKSLLRKNNKNGSIQMFQLR